MCFLDLAHPGMLLSLPTIMTRGQPASKNSWVKKGFRTCFNKAGDRPEEWNPSEFHLVSLGRNFTGFPAWQSPGGRMCRKAQGPQSLQVRSPASLSPLLASLSKWTLDLKFCWGGKLNTLLRDPQSDSWYFWEMKSISPGEKRTANTVTLLRRKSKYFEEVEWSTQRIATPL